MVLDSKQNLHKKEIYKYNRKILTKSKPILFCCPIFVISPYRSLGRVDLGYGYDNGDQRDNS